MASSHFRKAKIGPQRIVAFNTSLPNAASAYVKCETAICVDKRQSYWDIKLAA